MIKANELRVGNKILSIFDRIETVRMILGHEGYKDREDVHEIYKHLIGVEECGNQYNLAEIKPIPITEEILLKCGFRNDGFDANWFLRDDWFIGMILNKEDSSVSLYMRRDNFYLLRISHLHQLQNLYFALTGQELTYTP